MIKHYPVFNRDGYNPTLISSSKKEAWIKEFASINTNLKQNRIKFYGNSNLADYLKD